MRNDLRLGNLGEDPKSPYYEKRKYPEPTMCTGCSLVYQKGRWSNGALPNTSAGKVNKALCPACHRIEDREPGGLIYLSGSYIQDKQKLQEILNVVKNQERNAKQKRPLLRVMWVNHRPEQVEVATTNVNLAQRIGKAIHDAHSGELNIKFSEGSRFARVYWKRDQ